jgi:PleD family two-component response regulator
MAGLVRRMTPEGETSSAGVAGWDGAESGEALVARTDRALYRAKQNGRNCVFSADEAEMLA